jgi:hypothetical protein
MSATQSATQALLDDIAKLQAAQDSAGLKALEDHGDKQVRKAARKALHVLRSKGVAIADAGRAWAKSDAQSLRQHAGPVGMIDMAASPAVTRLTLSLPNEQEGVTLLIGLVDPTDRLLDFVAYYQTDGQQARSARDWQRDADGRSLPIAWVQARLYWAREHTYKQNYELPKAINESLPKLGEAPRERPEPSFLDEALASVEPAASDLGEILASGGVHTWPVLFDANELFNRLGEAMKDADPATLTNADRLAHIMSASKGDEQLRTGLRGPLAHALDDVAVVLYLDGSLPEARRVRQLATDLRGAADPEMVDGVVNLVQLQVTSAAMAQMRRQSAEQGAAHDHDHDHDHDHEHHVHDENCGHDHDHG